MRIKENITKEIISKQYQITRINIIIILWQTVRRITDKILGMKGLTYCDDQSTSTELHCRLIINWSR